MGSVFASMARLAWLIPSFSGIQRNVDRLMAIVILCMLAVLMLTFYLPLKKRTVVLSNAILGFEIYRRDIAHYWAIHGTWPDDATQLPLSGSPPVKAATEDETSHVTMENGVIHITSGIELNKDVLSCRPAVIRDNPSGPISWVCGPNRTLESEWSVHGPDRTTLDDHLVPIQLR